MNVAGHFIPPAFIYPRKRPSPELLAGGPTQSVCMLSDCGYVTPKLFVEWLHHFKDHVHASELDPVLLILDNHSSHISLEGVKYAQEHHIVILTIPSHSSHKLQPLDIAIHSHLKNKYAEECAKWISQHPGRHITQFQVASIFNTAFKHTATLSNAELGFKASRIFPFVDNLFDENDVAPSSAIDQNINQPVT
ncbi:hypothetical protein K1T71_006548 [Dendrolimus kikuchii]|uniref:Uncharacterized protein n=1 Tax=Dendrolimus kikuchii TaxID=765133 RepID=A0ACC1D1B9_9NEOP|nr:hypothetical protein K1T71_006548 [Dendrolimus kikuchii]